MLVLIYQPRKDERLRSYTQRKVQVISLSVHIPAIYSILTVWMVYQNKLYLSHSFDMRDIGK